MGNNEPLYDVVSKLINFIFMMFQTASVRTWFFVQFFNGNSFTNKVQFDAGF